LGIVYALLLSASSFDADYVRKVPATTAALKKIIARIFERTGWDVKELFTSDELADMIDAVVKEPPHMCVLLILDSVLLFFVSCLIMRLLVKSDYIIIFVYIFFENY
jgi:hypothetical protein